MAWLRGRPSSWDIVRRDFTWEELRGELDHAGVDKLILVQACPTPFETQRLLQIAEAKPSVIGVVGWVSLSSGRATEQGLELLDRWGGNKLLGIRNNHRWEPDGDVLATPAALDSCKLLAERGLPLDIHVPDYRDLDVALRVIEEVPDNAYIIDHLGKPLLDVEEAFDPWARSMSALSEFPNVYVKFSGWATFVARTRTSDVQRYIDFVLGRFSPQRVMFGSNWPVALLAGSYEDTFDASLEALASLNDSDRTHILRDTALRCYMPNGGETTETCG